MSLSAEINSMFPLKELKAIPQKLLLDHRMMHKRLPDRKKEMNKVIENVGKEKNKDPMANYRKIIRERERFLYELADNKKTL